MSDDEIMTFRIRPAERLEGVRIESLRAPLALDCHRILAAAGENEIHLVPAFIAPITEPLPSDAG